MLACYNFHGAALMNLLILVQQCGAGRLCGKILSRKSKCSSLQRVPKHLGKRLLTHLDVFCSVLFLDVRYIR